MSCRWRSAFSCWLTRAGCPRLPSWHVHTCPAWYLGTVHYDALLSLVCRTPYVHAYVYHSSLLSHNRFYSLREWEIGHPITRNDSGMCALSFTLLSLFVLLSPRTLFTSIFPVSCSTTSIQHSSFFTSLFSSTFFRTPYFSFPLISRLSLSLLPVLHHLPLLPLLPSAPSHLSTINTHTHTQCSWALEDRLEANQREGRRGPRWP